MKKLRNEFKGSGKINLSKKELKQLQLTVIKMTKQYHD